MDDTTKDAVKVDLHQADGDWQAVVEHDGQRQTIGGIRELIRYLEALVGTKSPPVRGLR